VCWLKRSVAGRSADTKVYALSEIREFVVSRETMVKLCWKRLGEAFVERLSLRNDESTEAKSKREADASEGKRSTGGTRSKKTTRA
jgi:hypothetical protein